MSENYNNTTLYLKQAVGYIPEIILSVILLCATYYLGRLSSNLVQFTFKKTHLKPALVEFIQKIFAFTIWICGILLAASIIFPSVTPAKVITALGFGSIAVGLAFKDIFEKCGKKPERLNKDRGSEMICKQFQQFLKKN